MVTVVVTCGWLMSTGNGGARAPLNMASAAWSSSSDPLPRTISAASTWPSRPIMNRTATWPSVPWRRASSGYRLRDCTHAASAPRQVPSIAPDVDWGAAAAGDAEPVAETDGNCGTAFSVMGVARAASNGTARRGGCGAGRAGRLGMGGGTGAGAGAGAGAG